MANRDLTNKEKVTLEQLVDATNVNAVLQALSEICGEKAAKHQQSHTVENETELHLASIGREARAWANAEGAIGCLATDKHVMAVSR